MTINGHRANTAALIRAGCIPIVGICIATASILPGCGSPLYFSPPSSRYFDTHSDGGIILDVAPGRALFVYYNGSGYRETYILSIGDVFQIEVPVEEYVAVEVEPGDILVTTKRPPGSFRYHTQLRNESYSLSYGSKIYISEHSNFRAGSLDELNRLERWKRPVAYIKLCDHNTRVCDDSPTKPPPKAVQPPEPQRRPPEPLS